MTIKWLNSFMIVGTVQLIDNGESIDIPDDLIDWLTSQPNTFYEVIDNGIIDSKE